MVGKLNSQACGSAIVLFCRWQTELTARGNRIWTAVGVVDGVGNLHSQICCSFSCHTFLPLLPLVSYHKVNWAGPIFDPNYIPMQLGNTGQPNPLSTHIYHISPPQPHDPPFQNSNMLPHPQSAWPSPIFPFQGPACLLCPLSCLSTKELKPTPNHDTSHQCTSRGRGGSRRDVFGSLFYIHGSLRHAQAVGCVLRTLCATR